MLSEKIKNVESMIKMVQEHEKNYAEANKKVEQVAKDLQNQIDDLKGKMELRKNELTSKISNLEKEISKKVTESVVDPEKENELREMSIELDLSKRQFDALSQGLRKTIIVACEKKLEELKICQKNAWTQQHVLCEIYIKYFKVINEAIASLNALGEEKQGQYSTIATMETGPNNMTLRPFMQYILDKEAVALGRRVMTEEEIREWHGNPKHPSEYTLTLDFEKEIRNECVAAADAIVKTLW
ncbi:UNVERIFIED_CONTAM: hypothetical protein Cloal_1151 [Acetivibrio alkalicellulosi]